MSVFQESLPFGIEIDKELPNTIADPPPGRLFRVRDARGFPEQRVVRFARLVDSAGFPDPKGSSWVRMRVHQLVDVPLPYVLTPLEAETTPEGAFFFLENAWEHALADKWPTAVDRRHSVELLEQLLTGLAALHDRGIAHGDLRLSNVALLPTGPEGKNGTSTSAWLANTPLGGLAYQTGGASVAADMKQYFPPEWEGRAQTPAPTADLYALGVIAHKLACQDRNALLPTDLPKRSWWKQCSRWFRQRLVGDPLDGVVDLLLREEGSRPKNGREALRRLRRWRRWVSCRGPLLIFLFVLLLLGIGLVWRGQALAGVRQQNQDLQTKASSAVAGKMESDEKGSERDRTIRELDKLLTTKDQEIASLKKKVQDLTPGPRGPDPGPAKFAWKAAVQEAKDEYVPELWQKHLEQIPDKVRKDSLPFFRSWEKIVLTHKGKADAWKGYDKDLADRWKQLLSQPWEEATVTAFDQRVAALDSAADIWKKWAQNDALKFGDLRNQAESEPETVRRILHAWLNDTESRMDWSLRLKSGTAPAGYGVYRGISVYGDQWTEDWHNWNKATSHQYQGRVLKFRWTADKTQPKPLYVTMQANLTWLSGGASRPYRIYRTFNGPLPIWRAHHEGQVSQNGFTLEFDVNDCPGPPRSPASTSIDSVKDLLK